MKTSIKKKKIRPSVEELADDALAQQKEPKSSESEVDVIKLLNKIDFSPDNVVDAAAVNPVLFVEAIKYRLQCLLKKSSSKMNSKRVRAERELSIRHKAKANDEKLTEGNITALLMIDPEVSQADSVLEKAEVFDEYSKLVVEAFRMRRDSLQIIKGMVSSEMSIGRAMEAEAENITETRQRLHNKFPGSDSDN